MQHYSPSSFCIVCIGDGYVFTWGFDDDGRLGLGSMGHQVSNCCAYLFSFNVWWGGGRTKKMYERAHLTDCLRFGWHCFGILLTVFPCASYESGGAFYSSSCLWGLAYCSSFSLRFVKLFMFYIITLLFFCRLEPHVRCTWTCAYGIYSAGSVFTWGSCKSGQLGQAHKFSLPSPRVAMQVMHIMLIRTE